MTVGLRKLGIIQIPSSFMPVLSDATPNRGSVSVGSIMTSDGSSGISGSFSGGSDSTLTIDGSSGIDIIPIQDY